MAVLGGFGEAFSTGKGIADDIALGVKRNRLSELASQAYSTPQDQQPALLGQMARIDPASAQAQQQAFESGEDRRNKTLVNMSKLLTSAPPQYREGIYQRIKPGLAQIGLAQVPDTYTPEVGKMAEQIVSAWGGLDGKGVPSELQTFNAMTQGMPDEDVLKARRIHLGLDGRASSAGYSQVKFKGSDGLERIGVLNGKTGQIDLPDGTSFDPETGLIAPTQPQPQGQPTMTQVQYATSDGQPIPQDELAAAQAAFAADARGESFTFPVGGPMPPPVAQGGVNPFVSRAPEAEAAAVAAAKERAEIDLLDERGAVEAQNAALKAEAEAAARLEADKAAAMPKRRLALQQATNKAANLNRALQRALPNINAWTAGTAGVPLSKLSGSAAADLRASLDTIEAIVAFDELQQMRASSPTGGALGSVTERELNLLASTIANVKQSQSPEQLRENLTFLGQQYNKVVQQMQADFEADARLPDQQGGRADADPLGIL